jgi:hypothetical protein
VERNKGSPKGDRKMKIEVTTAELNVLVKLLDGPLEARQLVNPRNRHVNLRQLEKEKKLIEYGEDGWNLTADGLKVAVKGAK